MIEKQEVFIKNGVKYYVGDCINFLSKYGRIRGELLEIGFDSFGGEYIYVKQDNLRDMRNTWYTYQLL